jgi:pyruvate dehydrogenase E1 component alpha subunit
VPEETTGEAAERTPAAERFVASRRTRERMFSPRVQLQNAMRPIPSRKTGTVRRHAAPLSSIIVAPNDPTVFSVWRILLLWSAELVLGSPSLRPRARLVATIASRPSPTGVLGDDASLDPARNANLPPELAVALYEHMVVARVLDEKVVNLRVNGVLTDYESTTGEEATIVGAVAGMNDEDWVFPGSRDVVATLWRGMPLSACAHRVGGTARDSGKGRSSSDLVLSKAARVAGGSPLVATHISHAVGFAWAARMRSSDVASLVLFGEDATRCADFHCGLNFAGVSRAPVVAVGRAPSPRTSSVGLAIKAVAYGLAGVRVDGGDAIAVWNVVREARRRAVAGLGGTLVEATGSNADLGRNADIDPIVRMRGHVERLGLWNEDRERHLQADVRADVDRAFADDVGAGRPASETQFEDVYADLPWHLREQRGS